MTKLLELNVREAQLKRRLRRHLSSLGYARSQTGNLVLQDVGKETIRQLHAPQRAAIVKSQREFVSAKMPLLQRYFASGNQVDPVGIRVRIERVDSGTWQGDLFRLATLTWSVPVSNGFGRRLRYLVWDDSNDKLIGIFAIGDPVFNLSVRDNSIGWTGNDRAARLVNLMDAYVLGAVPPYNMLLGGKMIACLIRSTDVYRDFQKYYGNAKGIISGEQKGARLLAVTTSSSMGRSSLYNRLKLDGVTYFQSVGFSGGWGHFHVPDALFSDMRDYLRDSGDVSPDMHAFGQGPNWRIRTLRSALKALGFKGDLLKHGIQREVFISLLADNATRILCTGKGRPDIKRLLSVDEVGALAIERWLTRRAATRPEYRAWDAAQLPELIKASYRQRQTDINARAA
ncbi:Druantia anti-phage system protein DruA [Burkholderia cepacia]|uniref:Druantia anti-phage system protein DruA n=1 Tax=Burkholderia cepacia TaxID=292 RepID=UPI002AB15EF8|nr:Druantia anti-phage system protein DruA [Burkholderia cepacia]